MDARLAVLEEYLLEEHLLRHSQGSIRRYITDADDPKACFWIDSYRYPVKEARIILAKLIMLGKIK